MFHKRELAGEIPDDLEPNICALAVPEEPSAVVKNGAGDEIRRPGEEVDAYVENFAPALLEIFEELGRMTLDVDLHFGDGACREEGADGGFADAMELVRAGANCWAVMSAKMDICAAPSWGFGILARGVPMAVPTNGSRSRGCRTYA